MSTELQNADTAASEAEVRRLLAQSWIGGRFSALLERSAFAWQSSASRELGRTVVGPIVENRLAVIATIVVAATVALLGLRLRSVPEPAVWVMPAAILAAALVFGVRSLLAKGGRR